MTSYATFIHSKTQHSGGDGFDPDNLPEFLFDFQRALVGWALRKGRAAIFADCGLGKTPMQLAWADCVVRETNRPVLILTPLAVSHQTCREAEKFGIECRRSGDGKFSTKIVATNYERLHYFNPDDFAGVVCDESSIMKNFGGKIKAEITEFMRQIRFRLLCTATAAPNDFFELGTSSEALGYLGYTDMITSFFKEQEQKGYLGWGKKTYGFRGHAEQPFWQWVCSWARACRRPSDLGFADDGFELPPLVETEYVVSNSKARDGMLFSTPALTLEEQREERRITIAERCEAAADNVTAHDGASVVWCHLNPEGDCLAKIIPDCKQVAGSMDDDEKEEILLAFQSGQLKRLVTKPKIGCFGLNWQHCHNVVTFSSHSYEQYYQLVRRCWRFGQANPVKVTTVTTDGEVAILANLRRKAIQADKMFTSLVRHMEEARSIDHEWKFPLTELRPHWL